MNTCFTFFLNWSKFDVTYLTIQIDQFLCSTLPIWMYKRLNTSKAIYNRKMKIMPETNTFAPVSDSSIPNFLLLLLFLWPYVIPTLFHLPFCINCSTRIEYRIWFFVVFFSFHPCLSPYPIFCVIDLSCYVPT